MVDGGDGIRVGDATLQRRANSVDDTRAGDRRFTEQSLQRAGRSSDRRRESSRTSGYRETAGDGDSVLRINLIYMLYVASICGVEITGVGER